MIGWNVGQEVWPWSCALNVKTWRVARESEVSLLVGDIIALKVADVGSVQSETHEKYFDYNGETPASRPLSGNYRTALIFKLEMSKSNYWPHPGETSRAWSYDLLTTPQPAQNYEKCESSLIPFVALRRHRHRLWPTQAQTVSSAWQRQAITVTQVETVPQPCIISLNCMGYTRYYNIWNSTVYNFHTRS